MPSSDWLGLNQSTDLDHGLGGQGGAREEYMRRKMLHVHMLSPSSLFICSHSNVPRAVTDGYSWDPPTDMDSKDGSGVRESSSFTHVWGPCRWALRPHEDRDKILMGGTAYVWLKRVPAPPDTLQTFPQPGVPRFIWWSAAVYLQKAWGSPEMGSWQ